VSGCSDIWFGDHSCGLEALGFIEGFDVFSRYHAGGMMKSLLLVLTAVPLLSACSNVRSPTQSTPIPAQQAAPPVPAAAHNAANWVGDATVLSSTGTGCGWGTATGDIRSGVGWTIIRTGNSVTLDEDIANWPTDDIPYTGSLDGTRFTATYVQNQDGICHFRGDELSGSFSADDLHFDAVETLVWGPPGHEVKVQRRWSGRRF
jgi:uncharacterized protein YceK